MSSARIDIQNWLAGEFAARLSTAFEVMTAERTTVEVRPAEAPADASLRWRQPFSNLAGAMWVTASEAEWRAIGSRVLKAAGIADSDPAQWKAECVEMLGQALAGAAQSMGTRLGIEVVPQGGEESAAPFGDIPWTSVHAGFGAEIRIGFEIPLLDALSSEPGKQLEPAHPRSKTFELLLDVELPVSVSFGRAQVPLKDCLKLTTGSIVELNRTIADQVEVIVNNCVIARGEVVVVDGNFGVRIQQVISRQERLRTLN